MHGPRIDQSGPEPHAAPRRRHARRREGVGEPARRRILLILIRHRSPNGLAKPHRADGEDVQRARVVHRTPAPAVADDDQLGAAAANLGKGVTQLRDLLAAEESAEVADEGEHHGLLAP